MDVLTFNHLLTDEEIEEQQTMLEGQGKVVIAIQNLVEDDITEIMFM